MMTVDGRPILCEEINRAFLVHQRIRRDADLGSTEPWASFCGAARCAGFPLANGICGKPDQGLIEERPVCRGWHCTLRG